ncbi:MAG: metal ABC transporter permease [Phycisphaeraceae bacterium]|nr:metal ABC transporter permease [Phycisphaeraceae bacterium]
MLRPRSPSAHNAFGGLNPAAFAPNSELSPVQTIRYLTDPDLAAFAWPGVVAAAGVAVVGSVLSIFVVLKRLAFIGQGVSHAAFGGVGVAFILGVTGVAAVGASSHEALVQDLGLLAIVTAFSLLAAMAIARMARRRQIEADTAIGVVLVATMALGSVLLDSAARAAAKAGRPPPPSIDGVLFGSLASVGWTNAIVAWAAAAGVLLTLWMLRRPMLFWAFDEPAAEAYGVPTRRMGAVLLVLLAVAIVVTMRLAGVILATAMLVLPGAAALRLSMRWRHVVVWSVGIGLLGAWGGLILSFETDLPAGPCVVGAQLMLFLAAWTVGAARGGAR